LIEKGSDSRMSSGSSSVLHPAEPEASVSPIFVAAYCRAEQPPSAAAARSETTPARNGSALAARRGLIDRILVKGKKEREGRFRPSLSPSIREREVPGET
jgi:hypothetical protein